jgi:hypothetical protein
MGEEMSVAAMHWHLICPSDQFQGATFPITYGFGNTVATVVPS